MNNNKSYKWMFEYVSLVKKGDNVDVLSIGVLQPPFPMHY